MKLARLISGLLALALFAFFAVPLPAAENDSPAAPGTLTAEAHPAAAAGDPLLEALLVELGRSKAQLKMDQVQAPYYIEYRVHEISEYIGEAAFGASREGSGCTRAFSAWSCA